MPPDYCIVASSLHRRNAIRPRRTDSSARVIPLFPERTASEDHVPEDAQLLERIGKQDHAAYEALVRRHATRYFRLACRFLSNRSEAEDIVQDAFLKLWEKPQMWQPGKNAAFTTWFYRIVLNQCLDYTKKKRPLQLIDEIAVQDPRETQEARLLEQEQELRLNRQISLLPERQRIALNLCFYEGLSNQEAADIMGIRLKALQSLLMRAKSTLRKELNLEGDEHA